MKSPRRHSDADAAVTSPNKSFKEPFKKVAKCIKLKCQIGEDNKKIRGTIYIPCINAEFNERGKT